MHLQEIWRFPVKSLRGERLPQARLTADGVEGDRQVHIRGPRGVLTARTRPGLLSLSATTGPAGDVLIDGHPWDGRPAAAAIRATAGPDATAARYGGPERFDVLNLTVVTDGALATLGHDPRRLRSNLVIAGVPGLAERHWPGRTLRIGDTVIGVLKLRARCVVTTVDPDSGARDPGVLRDIHRRYEGRFALDCWVAAPGTVNIGDPVHLTEEKLHPPAPGGWILGAPYTLPTG
ncbi:MOSC domain-containing protein [Kitasatospora sp. NPDC059571]|uniref:MOSC domain-containing protein n=1 Tax=Kitasatospora sp. NPDC059571 TaxID=3346871 RepID=UPI00369E392A